jgi:MFS family permease
VRPFSSDGKRACVLHSPPCDPDRSGQLGQLAAFASSLFGVGLFLGRVGCGYLLDQFFAPRVAGLLFAAVATGIAFLGFGHAIWSACMAAVLVGLGIGAEVDIIAYAQRNRERILEVAKGAFTPSGANTSLDDIAKQASLTMLTLSSPLFIFFGPF